jgi:hypothetical protein
MKPVPVGTRIRIISRSVPDSYDIGKTYTVTVVDDDNTFKAADDDGQTRDWIPWEDREPASPSLWDLLAPDFPDDLVLFLSCFDGIQEIALKREVVDAILRRVPDLHERVAALAATPEGAASIVNNQPRPLDTRSHAE